MAKRPEKRRAKPRKCKTEPAVPAYSRPWMAGFIAEALKSADVASACRVHALGIGEYLRARRSDPAFELACLEIDLIARQAAVATLEAAAARGDLNASKLKLLLAGLAALRVEEGDGPAEAGSLGPDAPEWLRGIVGACTGRSRHPGIADAVWATYRAAYEFFATRPSAMPIDFAPPGPCLDCCAGLKVQCPRCTVVFVARSNLGPECPTAEALDYPAVVRGEPIAAPIGGWFRPIPGDDDDGQGDGQGDGPGGDDGR